MNTINLTEEKSQSVAKAIQETVVATKTDIAKLETKIAESKADLLKWFVGGFITIVIMLIGLFATIILRK
jgi:uncharacterized membrane protein YukC